MSAVIRFVKLDEDLSSDERAAIEARLPANIDWKHARLPKLYREARDKLAAFDRADECAQMERTHAALERYAARMKDPTLEHFAQRIRLRAYRRVGELLKNHDGRGQHKKKGHVPLSRREAAAQARLSADEQKTAVRMAQVPAKEFELRVESASPPTVRDLGRLGIVKRDRPVVDKTAEVRKAIPMVNARNALEHLRLFVHWARQTSPKRFAEEMVNAGKTQADQYKKELEFAAEFIAEVLETEATEQLSSTLSHLN